MATFETTARCARRSRTAARARRRARHGVALGLGVRRHPLRVAAPSPGALALGRLTIASLAPGLDRALEAGAAALARRDVGGDRARRALLVRALQPRAERSRAARRSRARRPMLVNVGPIILAVLAGFVLHEGFPRRLLRGLCGRARGRGRDRNARRRTRRRGELGRSPLPRGRGLLRDRRRRPEAGAARACRR